MARSTAHMLRFPDDQAGGTLIGTDTQTRAPVRIPRQARPRGVTLIGQTGTGKTTCTEQMIDADIQAGLGVGVVDPHGDLVTNALSRIPKWRENDVCLLRLDDETQSVGINPFECKDPSSLQAVAQAASVLMHTFTAIWQVGPETPQLTQVLRHATRACIEAQATLDMIPLLLWDDASRARLLTKVRSVQTRAFFEAYGLKNRRDRELQVSSVVNKLDALLAEPLVARILCQARSTLDFRQAMDAGRILLIVLPPTLEEPARLLGSLMIGRILLATFSRADTPEKERRPFALYCDEFSRFASKDFAVLIAEARKFGLLTTIAFQSLSQVDHATQAAVQAAGSLIVFRVNGEDAGVLARNFSSKPAPQIVGEEPLRVTVTDVIGHLLHRGHPSGVVRQVTKAYLEPLEQFLRTPEPQPYAAPVWPVSYDCFDGRLHLTEREVLTGRSLLNDSLHRCMVDGHANVTLAPLALYVLAAAQPDGRAYILSFLLTSSSMEFFGPHRLTGFRDRAHDFCHPAFPNSDAAQRFVQAAPKKYRGMAEAVVGMLRELRACMDVLAREPVTEVSGRWLPKYQQRTYADMAGEVADSLVTMPPYHARVRLPSGEHVIQTLPAPPGLSGRELRERIRRITDQMKFVGITRPAAAIDEEIDKRYDGLRGA